MESIQHGVSLTPLFWRGIIRVILLTLSVFAQTFGDGGLVALAALGVLNLVAALKALRAGRMSARTMLMLVGLACAGLAYWWVD